MNLVEAEGKGIVKVIMSLFVIILSHDGRALGRWRWTKRYQKNNHATW